MTISDLESSLFKFLYDTFEVPLGIKIFENVNYVDFDTYDHWIVIDALDHSTGSIPKANFFLHISIKNGLINDKVVLNSLVDKICYYINPGFRFTAYSDSTAEIIGQIEVSNTSLAPVLQHTGGGSFRSLGVSFVYPGETPQV